MPIAPLDDLGRALRERVESARHDIDWSNHPLMLLYLRSGTGHLTNRRPSRDHRHAATRVRK